MIVEGWLGAAYSLAVEASRASPALARFDEQGLVLLGQQGVALAELLPQFAILAGLLPDEQLAESQGVVPAQLRMLSVRQARERVDVPQSWTGWESGLGQRLVKSSRLPEAGRQSWTKKCWLVGFERHILSHAAKELCSLRGDLAGT